MISLADVRDVSSTTVRLVNRCLACTALQAPLVNRPILSLQNSPHLGSRHGSTHSLPSLDRFMSSPEPERNSIELGISSQIPHLNRPSSQQELRTVPRRRPPIPKTDKAAHAVVDEADSSIASQRLLEDPAGAQICNFKDEDSGIGPRNTASLAVPAPALRRPPPMPQGPNYRKRDVE